MLLVIEIVVTGDENPTEYKNRVASGLASTYELQSSSPVAPVSGKTDIADAGFAQWAQLPLDRIDGDDCESL